MIHFDTEPLSDTIGILDVSISDPDGCYLVKYLDRSEVEREISIEFAEIDALCDPDWLEGISIFGREMYIEGYNRFVLRDIIKEFLNQTKTN